MSKKKKIPLLADAQNTPSGYRALDAFRSICPQGLFDRLSLVLFGIIAVIFLSTFRDYGYSWDEVEQNRTYGQAVLQFILTLGADRSALTTMDYYLYGGLYDALAELVPYLFPVDGFAARRIANISIGLLTLAGAWKTARLLAGPQAGYWTLLLLITTPAWYGHTFINAKDIPFAAGYIWSIYFILKVIDGLPKIPIKTAIGLGAAFGLSIGVRIGGALVILYLFMVTGLYLIGLLAAKETRDLDLFARSSAYKIFLSLTIAWIMMVSFWPYVLLHPVNGLLDALRATGHFTWDNSFIEGHISVLFNGRYLNSAELPWYYLPVYFTVKLPIPTLVFFTLGIVWGAIRFVRDSLCFDWPRAAGPGLLTFAILFPPVYAILTGATMYDGIRHFLFIIPPMACLAGICIAELAPVVARKAHAATGFLAFAIALLFIPQIHTMVQLHPFQYAYLNMLGGGIPWAAERFETEYWITSYREATSQMLDYARKYAAREGIPFEKRHFEVAVFGNANNVKVLVPDNFSVTNFYQTERADFFIATTRYGSHKMLPQWPVIEEVGRMGMLFAVVKTSLPLLNNMNNRTQLEHE